MKYSYETHYKSHRPDGRIVGSLPAELARMRQNPLALDALKNPTKEEYLAWQKQIRAKATELLCMPPMTEQPAPVRLSTVQREGYRVEKWEFYPDEIAAVPVLVLIPDTATEEHPAPLVFCFPGSHHSKEMHAGEPRLPGEACNVSGPHDLRNRMGKYYAEAGMVAVCFDNPSISELAPDHDEPLGGWDSRTVYGEMLLREGYNYTGLAARNAFCFFEFMKTQPYVDAERFAVSGHSLGTETAIRMAMVSDEVKAVVYNEVVNSHRTQVLAWTEYDSPHELLNLCSSYHIIPGEARFYDHKDLCAAMAPRPLAVNEGGAEEFLNDIRNAYACLGAEEQLQITHYPRFADPESRNRVPVMPLYGLSNKEYYEHINCDVPDHSFRAEPSVAFLKKHFGL
ncbi:MAG: hypothetical protein J6R89_08215 [Clostridia bacterium]|nr:hypothetical protein [Clostridia bacterium]